MSNKGSSQYGNDAYRVAAGRADMWPGITAGFDARCSCTWAMHAGVYQVKLRDASACLLHAGALDTVLARIERGAL